MVHVDDLARAHIFLLEYPNAKGRYICALDYVTIGELSNFLSAKYPEFPIPTAEWVFFFLNTCLYSSSNQETTSKILICFLDRSLKDNIKGFKGMSSKKLMDCGFEFKYGLDEMFDEAIQCCKEKGYI